MKIAPHIFWPGLVITILLGSISSAVVLVVASRQDGGAQAIPDYYQAAVEESQRSQTQP